nr:cytochrome c biogenesis protein [Mesostigma viride]
MNLIEIETYLANASFAFLLITMLIYGMKVIFTKNNILQLFGTLGILFSNFLVALLLSIRWFDSHHFPLSNMYESLMFLCWCFTFFHLLIEKYIQINFIGFITVPIAMLVNAFATFFLPLDMQYSTPLVPALKSNWLIMHVTIMMASYAALILGSLLSIAFLFLTYNTQIELQGNSIGNINDEMNSNITIDIEFQKNESIELAKLIDNLSYRTIGIGFPLLTIGIISGAVWANDAWGSYWSWDPKETWALITWIIFAIYLHTRITKGWQGRRPAIVAFIGFVIVWVCYLGVNLLGQGLHSYGWFTK